MTAEAVKDLADLKDAMTDGENTETEGKEGSDDQGTMGATPRTPNRDDLGRSYGTGRRKDAVARVWVMPGTGKITVNGIDQTIYFKRKTQQLVINQPFLVTDKVGQFDINCTVRGGGLSGQAGAVRHGVSRALDQYDPSLHALLKKAGFLTRDSRRVEPKKIGKHGARRTKQWAKR